MISATLQQILETSEVSLCRLYYVRRKDGVEYLFTDWPLAVSLTLPNYPLGAVPGAVKTFYPEQSPKSSALSNDTSLSVSNAKYESYFTLTGISSIDIKAKKFENAEVLFFLCDPNLPGSVSLIQSGYIGGFKEEGGDTFSMDFRSIAQLLQQNIGDTVTELCPYRYGEPRCGKQPLIAEATIVLIEPSSPRRNFIIEIDGFPVETRSENFWRNGVVEIISSGTFNGGVLMEIVNSQWLSSTATPVNRTSIQPLQSFPFDLVVGERVKLLEGCLNTVADCSRRGNIANYGGFPFLPGNDALVSNTIPDSSSASPGGKK
jgi:uncharacterized phage protein (TIGR02218 family)